MSSIWDDVVGQRQAVENLNAATDRGPVHAYLFVGPAGSTKYEAARAFAARVLSGGDDANQRDARLALCGEHPDVREVRRVGASISLEQAQEIVRVSALAPIEGDRKVLILDEFHLLRPEGAAVMLKTIEEPPPSTIFVILADFVPHELITISSRCARIEFKTISDDLVATRLLTEGVGPVEAQAAAKASMGDLDRARLLANDPGLAERRTAFRSAPTRLDGTGTVAFGIAVELLGLIDDAVAPLVARHADEVAENDERIKEHGERGSGKKQLEERHRRELRRHRTDEIRAGLGAMAAVYRDQLTQQSARDIEAAAGAVRRIHEALEALDRNPNERLLLESVLWSLPAA